MPYVFEFWCKGISGVWNCAGRFIRLCSKLSTDVHAAWLLKLYWVK